MVESRLTTEGGAAIYSSVSRHHACSYILQASHYKTLSAAKALGVGGVFCAKTKNGCKKQTSEKIRTNNRKNRKFSLSMLTHASSNFLTCGRVILSTSSITAQQYPTTTLTCTNFMPKGGGDGRRHNLSSLEQFFYKSKKSVSQSESHRQHRSPPRGTLRASSKNTQLLRENNCHLHPNIQHVAREKSHRCLVRKPKPTQRHSRKSTSQHRHPRHSGHNRGGI